MIINIKLYVYIFFCILLIFLIDLIVFIGVCMDGNLLMKLVILIMFILVVLWGVCLI